MDRVEVDLLDMTDTASVYDAVGRVRPAEVYHLAASLFEVRPMRPKNSTSCWPSAIPHELCQHD